MKSLMAVWLIAGSRRETWPIRSPHDTVAKCVGTPPPNLAGDEPLRRERVFRQQGCPTFPEII